MSVMEMLKAEVKNTSGKGGARALRRNGLVPCIIYGDEKEPAMVSIDQKTVMKHSSRPDFYSRVVELSVDGKNLTVLPKDVQYHPVTDRPLHVDFLRVSKSSEIRLHVPVEFINEDKSPAIKLGAILNVVQRTVEVLCSPLDIPEKFEIDLSGTQLGATFTLKDLKIPVGCRLGRVANANAVLANIVQTDNNASEEEAVESVPANSQ